MDYEHYPATTVLVFDLLITDQVTGDPIDPGQLAFSSNFVPRVGSAILHTDIYEDMGSLITRSGVGTFQLIHDTTPYVAGGQLNSSWFARNAGGNSAQGTVSWSITIDPLQVPDPFL